MQEQQYDPASGLPMGPGPSLATGANPGADGHVADDIRARIAGIGAPDWKQQQLLQGAQQPATPPGSDNPDMSKVVSSSAGPGAGSSDQAAPAKPQVIPEHWVNTLSPQVRGQLLGAEQQQIAGVEGESQAQRDFSTKSGDIKADAVGQFEGFNKQAADVEKQKDAEQNHLDELIASRRAQATQKVDPNRYMKSKSTIEKVGMGIAMALGGFGAALTHTQNGAADIIHSAIDNDIKAQEQDLATNKDALEGEQNLVAHKIALFGDKTKGIAAARQQLLADTEYKVGVEASKYQDPIIAARAQQLIAEIRHKSAVEQAGAEHYQPAAVRGGYGMISDVKPDEVVRLPDGRQVTIPEKDREKVIGAINQSNTVHDAATDVRHLLATPITSRGLSWMKQYDAAQEVLAKAELAGGGKGGKGLIEMNAKAGGGRTLTLTPGAAQALAELERGSAATAHSAIGSSAQHEVREHLVPNAKGVVERRYEIVRPYQREGTRPEQAPGQGGLTVGTPIGGQP